MKSPIRIVTILIVALPLCFLPGQALAKAELNVFVGQKNMDLNVDPEFDDAEDQDNFGLAFSYGGDGWPVMLAVDVLSSSGDANVPMFATGLTVGAGIPVLAGFDLDVETRELDVGIRKFWGEGKKWSPYVGGGAAYVQCESKWTMTADAQGYTPLSNALIDDDADEFGFWVNSGIAWRIGEKFSLGFDVRYSDAEAELNYNQNVDPALVIILAHLDGVSVSQLQSGPDSEEVDAGGVHAGLTAGFRW